MLRWLPTFFAFPLGGLAADLISGPVDGTAAALVGGAITGTVLGAVQAWGMRPAALSTRRWIAATAVGFSLGLGIASKIVGYRTGVGDLIVQGAICGVIVGAAQAVVLWTGIGRIAFAWPAFVGAIWAAGWAITTAAGVDVDNQFTVFGSSGALVVTAATAALPVVLATRATRATRADRRAS
jgi:hypothetical protein